MLPCHNVQRFWVYFIPYCEISLQIYQILHEIIHEFHWDNQEYHSDNQEYHSDNQEYHSDNQDYHKKKYKQNLLRTTIEPASSKIQLHLLWLIINMRSFMFYVQILDYLYVYYRRP